MILTLNSVSETITKIEAPDASHFVATRYPYTYAYDYMRTHRDMFGLPHLMSRAQCAGLFRDNPDGDAICVMLADAYLRENRMVGVR